jgi:HopJ type III effector protein
VGTEYTDTDDKVSGTNGKHHNWGGAGRMSAADDNDILLARRQLLTLGICGSLAAGFTFGAARAADDITGRSTKENFMNELKALQDSFESGQHMFDATLKFVAAHYDYKPQAFRNGELENAAGENEGSCKTLGLAKLEGLSDREALLAFGEHYRSVLAAPNGTNHGNIRSLMVHGLAGVTFAAAPLTRKTST